VKGELKGELHCVLFGTVKGLLAPGTLVSLKCLRLHYIIEEQNTKFEWHLSIILVPKYGLCYVSNRCQESFHYSYSSEYTLSLLIALPSTCICMSVSIVNIYCCHSNAEDGLVKGHD